MLLAGFVVIGGAFISKMWVGGSERLRREILDPIPQEIRASGLGVRLVPFAHVPGVEPPRLNQLRVLPDGRMFVNDQRGVLYEVDGSGRVSTYLRLTEYIDLFFPKERNGQVGFMSFAFHPEFGDNGVFYTTITSTLSGVADFPAKRPILDSEGRELSPDHDDVLLRWICKDPGATVFSGEARVLMRIEQPYRDHNMGEIAFNPRSRPGDPDYGILYIGVADGGSQQFPVAQTDPLDNGQDTQTPLGAILRIDPEGTSSPSGAYGVPGDNPWVGSPAKGLGEIFAYGLRNPHRMHWDNDGTLYVFDVGQWFIEEINRIEPGANYGWGEREGRWVVDETNEFALFALPEDDERFGFRYPIVMYDHPGDPTKPWTGPGAIAGGAVYRGRAIPYLQGKLVFADFSPDGRFFVVDRNELEGGSNPPSVLPKALAIYDVDSRRSSASRIINGVDGERTDVRIGVGVDGELFVTNKRNGWIYRLAPIAE